MQGLGAPVVTVLLSGRPLWSNRELNRSRALLAAWLPGTEGKGVADVLFRRADGTTHHDFVGRLPFSWPSDAAQAEVNVGDLGPGAAPLFPYGYGLSYARPAPLLGNALDESGSHAGPAAATPLAIFQRVQGEQFKLYLGSPADWRLALGDDAKATPRSADGLIQVAPDQLNVREDARRVTWHGDAEFKAMAVAGPTSAPVCVPTPRRRWASTSRCRRTRPGRSSCASIAAIPVAGKWI